MANALVLAMVMLSTEALPTAPGFGANDLEIVGRAATVSVSLAASALLPALVVVSPPAAMVLASAPEAVAVTLTVTVHEPFAGITPPESATLEPPFAAVTVPEQPAPPMAPAGVAVFTRFVGYVSVKAAPVTAVALV